MNRWRALIVLALTQFLMVLDQSVMNVSISQLVEDFDTTVSSIQAVITFYSLVMAALMMSGAKLGDIFGRRRILVIGLIIYGAGSALTAASWSVASLTFGWSVLEGIGAAMVMPAMAALVASSYQGTERVTAYGVIGGVAGAGIAIGPILGGWATTELSWRVIFAGEVLVALFIIATSRWIADAPREGAPPRFDVGGSILSASGMTIMVFGLLQASTWGWVQPKSSPVEPFGFALTPFVVAGGLAVLYGFAAWERRRKEHGADALIDLALFGIARFRSGLSSLLAQNLILMGVFFAIPLYLQVVLGLDAFETGLRMLPTSLAMVAVSFSGALLLKVLAPRAIVRLGLLVLIVASLTLIGTIDPTLDSSSFALAMALLGAGMGLLASQLGNIIQGSVGVEARSEAGGLQFTAQQLGSSIGVALIGAIVLSSLVSTYVEQVASDPQISAATADAVAVQAGSGASFVTADQVASAVAEAGITGEEATALVETYEDSQLRALKSGLLAVAFLAAASLLFTRDLPSARPGGAGAGTGAAPEAATA